MKKLLNLFVLFALLALAFGAQGVAPAMAVSEPAPLAVTVANGGFETGDFTGWNAAITCGSTGWYVYSGGVSPQTGATISPPPQGTYAVVADQFGPTTSVLYQDIVLEAGYSHTLSFYVYYTSYAPLTTVTSSLDCAYAGANQQYRVDVMDPAAGTTSVAAGDVLGTIFQTQTNDSVTLAPTLVTFDLTPWAGQTIRLRFAQVNNQGNFFPAVDDVQIVSTLSDTTPPQVTVPSDITAEATSSSGAVVDFAAEVSATDETSPANPAVTCTPASGSTFSLGTTPVTCQAADDAGNTGYGYFNVTVEDTTAPTLNLPANISVPQTSPAGAVVNYEAGATDMVDGVVQVSCTPASGSLFPVGNTSVTCAASDTAGNEATDTFIVMVEAGANLLVKSDFGGVYVFPYPWAPTGITAPYSTSIDCNIFISAPCSARITGNGVAKAATQTLRRPGLAGDQFSFGLSSRAMNVPKTGQYKVEVLFYNQAGQLVGSSRLNFTRGTHEWESLSGVATAPADYTMIRVRFIFQVPSGKAWFDDAFLYQIP